MNEEIDVIEKNNTWHLVDLLASKESIGVKWVYKTNFNEKGNVKKHKTWYPDRDYKETFSTIVRIDTVRIVLEIAAQNK